LAKVDKLERDDFVAKMETTPPHTSDERKLMVKSLVHADYRLVGGRVEKSEDVSDKWKRIRGGGNIYDLAVKRFTKFKKGDATVWGKATATIHPSSKQVFSWMWLYTSNHRMKSHQKKERNIIRQSYKPPNKKANDEEQVITNKSERQAALSDET